MVSKTTQSILKAVTKAGQYVIKRKDQRPQKRRRKKSQKGGRLTLVLLCFMFGVAIFTVSHSHSSTSGSPSAPKTPSAASNVSAGFTGLLDPYNKILTLQSSADAALTAYPNKSKNALASSVIDQKLGNQASVQQVGKGGIAGAPFGACNVSIPHTSFSLDICPGGKGDPNDILTGTNGALFGFPQAYTVNNGAVKALLLASQVIAWAGLTLIIALIGLNVAMGGITSRFGRVVESIPRLILAMFGVGACALLTQQVLGFAGEATAEFMGVVATAIDPTVGQGNIMTAVVSVIPNASSWNGVLKLFFWLCAGMLIARALSPLGFGLEPFFEITIGPIIAIVAMIALTVAMIANTERLFLTILAMSLLVQVFLRIVLINFYIVLSPLAVVVTALPGNGGVKFARDWVIGFFGLVMSQFGQIAVLMLGLVLMDRYQLSGNPSDIVSVLLKYGTLLLMMRVPTLFKSNAASLALEAGSAVAGTVAHQRMVLM